MCNIAFNLIIAIFIALVHADVVTEIRIKTSDWTWSESSPKTTFSVYYDGDVWACRMNAPLKDTEYGCVPSLVGKDCDNIGAYPQILVQNPSTDALIVTWIQFSTSSGDVFTADGFCGDAAFYAAQSYYSTSSYGSSICTNGDKYIHQFVVKIQTDMTPEVLIIFAGDANTRIQEALISLGASVTYDGLNTDCGCAEFGGDNGHLCQCQAATCDSSNDYCNTALFVGKRLKVSSALASCPIASKPNCCCSCPNCPNYLEEATY